MAASAGVRYGRDISRQPRLRDLTRIRRLLTWYLADIDTYILARQWTKISQEEAFAGRCAEVGEDVGLANVAARIARELMRRNRSRWADPARDQAVWNRSSKRHTRVLTGVPDADR